MIWNWLVEKNLEVFTFKSRTSLLFIFPKIYTAKCMNLIELNTFSSF